MYKIRKTKRIEAAHHLPNHDGKCARPHGHTFTITFEIEGATLNTQGPKAGMVIDYYDVGQVMKDTVEIYDHQDLNAFFENPTSENIAQAIFAKSAPLISDKSNRMAHLLKVLVSETQDSVAEYEV